jgi:Mn-dependent DtxR family transcriptional regulator
MSSEVWKEYEANLLTHSAAHYLMTIHDLLEQHGYARVTDIAREMNITRGSCSISLKPLKKRGLVVEDENKFLRLSDEGQLLAGLVARNDDLLKTFFHEVLGVDKEQAEIDACKIEHLLSIETSMRLAGFIECIKADKRVVVDFLKEVRKAKQVCTHDVERCEFCEGLCVEEVQIAPAKRRKRKPAKV